MVSTPSIAPPIKLSWKEVYPRFVHLREECLEVFRKHAIDNQCMVQTLHKDIENWEYGTGRSKNIKDNIKDFSFIQPSLVGSELERYFNWLEVPVWRSRLLGVPPKATYSVHTDREFRLHLPIVTNPQCFMLFPDEYTKTVLGYHLPADGSTHWTNTRTPHSMINCHETEFRIHLVMCTHTGSN